MLQRSDWVLADSKSATARNNNRRVLATAAGSLFYLTDLFVYTMI